MVDPFPGYFRVTTLRPRTHKCINAADAFVATSGLSPFQQAKAQALSGAATQIGVWASGGAGRSGDATVT
jgi:hypothetical protein